MTRTSTKELTVILEADPDEEGWFSIVSVNGKAIEQCQNEKRMENGSVGVFEEEEGSLGGPTLKLVEIQEVKVESDRLTDEQCLLEMWSNVGTDMFWSHDEPPDMKGKLYIKLVGRIWWEEYNSIDYGRDYDSGFDVDSEELLDSIDGSQDGKVNP